MSRYPGLQEHCAILVAPTTEELNAGQAVQLWFPTSGLYVPAEHAAAPAPVTRTSFSIRTLLPGPITNKYLPTMADTHVIVLLTPTSRVLLAHTAFCSGSVE